MDALIPAALGIAALVALLALLPLKAHLAARERERQAVNRRLND